ncbi:hypothetical protein FHG08_04220 [Pseudoalteromonas sp. Scap03]|uniref:hypothetical protein n=1 Tax=unclassified Pseudoalteromonas TaxID=194690 RepID=UPI0015BCD965|nr:MULTISPECIES: hypothetical protein [unclassified Pseudoalteromonas]NWL14974.1 hypothetical protein [Pseudoalteromonas sp. Scap03]QLE80106.1 hypothetical protein FLM54_00485 [Pseudoalteromonas sp. Scap25]QLE88048.1 hypothetical protein FLM47_00485 [Pseudoalteromonas sp. Scap06]
MRIILFLILCIWQCSAQATTYFVKDKSCENTSDTLVIKTEITLSKSDDEAKAQKDLRAEALSKFKNATKKSSDSQIHIKEKFLIIRETNQNNLSSSDKRHLHYTAYFTPSKNCNEQQAMSKAVFIEGEHLFGILQSTENKITISFKNKKPLFKEFDSKLVKPNFFFGTKFGQSTQEVAHILGLHSLELKSENKLIRVYGRNHALHFINNQLVGYQFHLNLLPMQINNVLTLENKELKIKLNNDVVVEAAAPITPLQIKALKKKFVNVETAYYKSSDTKIEQRLIGLSQGQLIGKVAFNKHCIKSFTAKADGNFNKNLNTSLKLISSSEKNINVTPCSEFLYEEADSIAKLKLFEPISTNNIKLAALADYFKQGNSWEFSDIKYKDPVANLAQLGDYYELFDSVEFTSQYWDGYFYINDGKLLNAELTSNDF